MAKMTFDKGRQAKDAHAQKRAKAIRRAADEEFFDEEYDEYDYDRSVKLANRGCLIAFLGLMVAIALALLIVYMSIAGELNGKKATATGNVTVEVPAYSGGSIVGGILKDKGLITNDSIFRFYARFNGATFRAGEFELIGGMSYDEILGVLTAPEPERDTVRVTFAEGRTVWQYGEVLEKAGICTAQEFVDAANDIEKYKDIKFFEYIDYDPDTYMKAEGYMSPNTYDLYTDENPYSVARRLYEQFNRELEKIEFRTEAGNMGFYERLEYQAALMPDGMKFTLKDAIALASMVEEEASYESGNQDQARVAGVFWNRLTKDIAGTGLGGRTLGSDVTVYYVRDMIARSYGDENSVPQNLKYAYLCLDTPESRVGLPAGPLSNPSIAAIKAALQPEPSNNFFFVTDKYGTYYYATTYNQHQGNVATADRMNAQKEQEDAAAGSNSAG